MSIYGIHAYANMANSNQIWQIHVNSCHSCQFMTFMSFYGIHFICHRPFPQIQVSGGWGGGVKYVFLGLRRQLRCLAEGKNVVSPSAKQYLVKLSCVQKKRKDISAYPVAVF
jgi:hypothetical protein